jgi:hypothetical protein
MCTAVQHVPARDEAAGSAGAVKAPAVPAARTIKVERFMVGIRLCAIRASEVSTIFEKSP